MRHDLAKVFQGLVVNLANAWGADRENTGDLVETQPSEIIHEKNTFLTGRELADIA